MLELFLCFGDFLVSTSDLGFGEISKFFYSHKMIGSFPKSTKLLTRDYSGPHTEICIYIILVNNSVDIRSHKSVWECFGYWFWWFCYDQKKRANQKL